MLQEAGDGDKEVHFDPFADLPADFGPEVPDEGVDGLLFVSASWDTVRQQGHTDQGSNALVL